MLHSVSLLLIYLICSSESHAANLSLPTALSPLVTISLYFMSVSLFMYIHLFYFLDSTYKWYYIVFVFLWPILLSTIFSSSIYIAANGNISFSFVAEYYSHIYTYIKESEVAQSCLTLCDPMDCSLPGSSVHGIFQAIVLEWIAISFSRGIFPTQGWNPGLPHCRQTLYCLSHQESPIHIYTHIIFS